MLSHQEKRASRVGAVKLDSAIGATGIVTMIPTETSATIVAGIVMTVVGIVAKGAGQTGFARVMESGGSVSSRPKSCISGAARAMGRLFGAVMPIRMRSPRTAMILT